MSYPGDQQQPGGWGPPQPPQSPYGPVEDQAGSGGSPYEGPQGGGPYEDPYGGPPRDGGFGPGGGYGGPGGPGGQSDPGGQGGSFGAEQPDGYGGDSFERGPSFGAESPDPYGGPGGPGGHEPGGYGPGGYEPGGFEQGGFDPGGYDPGDGGRSKPDRKRLIIGVAIVAGIVVVGGGTAFALTSGGDDKPKAAAAPTSSAPAKPTPTPTPSPTETGRGERLQSRTTDPRPLTLNEIFKAKTFKSGGRKYYMTGRRAERKCSPPTHGTKFRKALARGGCTQVLRATFSNGHFIGTIGVLNLRTQASAESAKTASLQKDAFILALPGVGSTKKIGQGLSLTTAEVDGHYLIMSWVQYPNGKKIAKNDYSPVTTFVKSTTYGSGLRTALNYRSMEGKPS